MESKTPSTKESAQTEAAARPNTLTVGGSQVYGRFLRYDFIDMQLMPKKQILW